MYFRHKHKPLEQSVVTLILRLQNFPEDGRVRSKHVGCINNTQANTGVCSVLSTMLSEGGSSPLCFISMFTQTRPYTTCRYVGALNFRFVNQPSSIIHTHTHKHTHTLTHTHSHTHLHTYSHTHHTHTHTSGDIFCLN